MPVAVIVCLLPDFQRQPETWQSLTSVNKDTKWQSEWEKGEREGHTQQLWLLYDLHKHVLNFGAALREKEGKERQTGWRKGKRKKQARRCREDEDRYEGAGEKEIKKGEVNYRGGQRGKWQEEREEGERANGHRRSRLSDSVNPGLGSLPHSLPW